MALNYEYIGAPAPHEISTLLASARQCAEEILLRDGRLPMTCLYQRQDGGFVTLTPQLRAATHLAQVFAALRGYLLADGATAYALLGEARTVPLCPTDEETRALVFAACTHDGALRTVLHALQRENGHTLIGPAQFPESPCGIDSRLLQLLCGVPTRSVAAQLAAREQVLRRLADSPITMGAWHPHPMPRPC